jgi:hypothetical protein
MPLSQVCHLFTSRSCTHHFSASCCNEAFKIATSSAAYLDNYFMLMGMEGVYSHTFDYQKRKDCPVCGGESLEITIPKSWTVERLIEMLVERQEMCVPSPFVSRTPTCVSDVQTAKSRGHHCRHQRSTSTFKHRRNWRQRHDQIWRNWCRSSSQMGGM